ncbi:MAG TPA: universal stress protein [candidate division Zixibacteria bacterium]|nr:universal stress protein [candidate division Zixibacteria bacterium]
MDVVDSGTVKSDRLPPSCGSVASDARQANTGFDQGVQGQAPATRLLACIQYGQDEEMRAYADYLCGLVQGQISYLDIPAKGSIRHIKKEVGDCDLIVFGEPKRSLLKRLLSGRPCHEAVNEAPVSILVTSRPRWPIQTILLIVQVEETDEAAVDWVGRLAQPSDAKVTILPVLSSFPSVYVPASSEESALGEILSPNTQPGRQLRCLSKRLAQWQIESTLRIRQGEPEWQIHWEVLEGDYDLIVIGAEFSDRWRRLLLGELVAPMLAWLNRPLLIARPVRTAQSTVGEKGHG